MRLVPALILIPLALATAGEDPTRDLSDVISVEITEVDTFIVVGMKATSATAEDVEALWTEFVQRIHEIPDVQMDDAGYGITMYYDAGTGEFTYMAAVQSGMSDPLPEGMHRLTVPTGEYAVFTFPFHYISDIYNYVYSTWLPESSYARGTGYDFEYYPANFEPTEEGVTMQLFVSIDRE